MTEQEMIASLIELVRNIQSTFRCLLGGLLATGQEIERLKARIDALEKRGTAT